LHVIHAVALAVEHAHRHGVVHRDLKPGNVMIARDGTVFVVDFGVAYLRDEPSLGLTQQGDVVGTAGFMSPEQARGDPDSRLPTSDVYGLGATLYHLVTGRPPFERESPAATVRAIVEEDPIPPRRLQPGLDERVEAVAWKALAKEPRRRYPSAAAF